MNYTAYFIKTVHNCSFDDICITGSFIDVTGLLHRVENIPGNIEHFLRGTLSAFLVSAFAQK